MYFDMITKQLEYRSIDLFQIFGGIDNERKI